MLYTIVNILCYRNPQQTLH